MRSTAHGPGGRSVGVRSSRRPEPPARASCCTPCFPAARRWPWPTIPGGTLRPRACRSSRRRCSSRRSCRGRARSSRRAARTSTTTRSRCGSSRSRSCRPGCPPTTVWGYGAVASANKRGLLVHNAPSLTIEARWDRPVRVKWINELVDEHGNYLPHLLPVDPTLHWANPPGGVEGRDSRPTFDDDAGRLQRPRADGDARARRGRRRRRERRLRRGVVPAGGRRHPRRLRDGGHLVRLLRRQGGGAVRRRVGAGLRDVPVPERPARVDDLVPRPHPRDDPPERVRRPGRLLPDPRRTRRRRCRARQPLRHDGRAARPRAEGERQVPVEQDVLRDPDRRAGPVVQRRRLAVLPRHPGVLRRHRRATTSPTASSRRSGTRSSSAT